MTCLILERWRLELKDENRPVQTQVFIGCWLRAHLFVVVLVVCWIW